MSDVVVEDLPSGQASLGESTLPTATDASALTSLGSLELVRYFSLEYPTSDEKSKLTSIWNYAKDMTDEQDRESILMQVVRLKNSLGSPRLGESSLDRVYRWVKLKRQEALIQEEMRGL